MLPGSIESPMNGCRLAAEASGIERSRMRPNPFALYLDGDDDERLVASAAAPDPILLFAHEGFIDFDTTMQPIASGPNHSAA